MSDGGLSEELEDVTEDEESECFKHLAFLKDMFKILNCYKFVSNLIILNLLKK